MKHKIFPLLLAIVAGTSMIFASDYQKVKIGGLYYKLDKKNQIAEIAGLRSGSGIIDAQDNSIADWDWVPAEYVAVTTLPVGAYYMGLKSIKVYADQTYINILVEPNMNELPIRDWLPFQVFINTDNSDDTGGFGDLFTDANSDILLEGGVYSDYVACNYFPDVFPWIGEVGGTGWEWGDVYPSQSFCKTQHVNGFIELQMVRELIPTNAGWDESEFSIGFAIDQNWDFVGILPQVPSTTENPYSRARKLQVKIDKDSSSDDEMGDNLVIPATVTYEGVIYTVTSIGEEAFRENSDLTSVVIPNSITSIGSSAFYGCSSLTSVTIPNSVTSIGSYAFYGCSGLTSVTIPNSVRSIADYAFYNCRSLTSVTIPNSVTSIGDGTFYWCSSLTSVTIPNSVTSIGDGTFYGCSSLTSVTIPNSVTSIGNCAFYNCSSLTSVTIPNSVTSIGRVAFELCGSLASVIIPNSVTSIEERTFAACSSLTQVTIPNSATSIGYAAFYGCSGLTSVAIGNGVMSIGEQTFYDCQNLETVSLGKSLETIDSEAFKGCERIIDIYSYAERVPTVQTSTFDGVSRKAYVWVPANRVRNYQTHEIWGEFDIHTIGAASVETDEVKVESTTNTADVVWPAVDGAYTYELVIKDKQGNVICTLIFNANGQLTEIAFNAPKRDNATEHIQSAGFSFTVTGLEEGTTYDLTITAKDSTGQTLQTSTQTFTTEGLSGVEDIVTGITPTKVLYDGQVLILRGDKTYTVQGQEVR